MMLADKTCPLLSLPVELQSEIAACLISQSEDSAATRILPLASTCSALRRLFMPLAVRELVLRNYESAAESFRLIRESAWAHCVKEVRINPSAKVHDLGTQSESDSQDSDYEEQLMDDDERTYLDDDERDLFPPIFEHELRSLSSFPKADRMIIEFSIDLKLADIDGELHFWDETIEDTLQVERINPARRMMALTMHTIFAHFPKQIQSLQFLWMDILKVSAFEHENFANVLKTIKTFELILGDIDCTCVQWGNRCDGFDEFLPWIGLRIFQELRDAESITFEPNIFVGDMPHLNCFVKASFCDATLRNLKHLNLHCILICPELRGFLKRHLGSIESVSLSDCLGEGKTQSPRETWHGLFQDILYQRPAQLLSFYVVVGLAREKLLPDDGSAERYLVEEDREDRLIFPYGSLYPTSARRRIDTKACQTAALRGDDERSFRDLEALIVSNGQVLGRQVSVVYEYSSAADDDDDEDSNTWMLDIDDDEASSTSE